VIAALLAVSGGAVLVALSRDPAVTAAEGADAIEVRAAILSSEGEPFGGSFAVVALPDRAVLARARTDGSGRLAAKVQVPSGVSALSVVVFSRGMLRHTPDERGPHAFLRRAELESADWELVFGHIAEGKPLDPVLAGPADASGVLPAFGGTAAVDYVRKTLPVGNVRDGALDFGELKFPTAHPWFRVEVDLVGADGTPYDRPVSLAGLPYHPTTMHGNRFYPHFAVSQEGAKATILGDRAAWRLLLANPEKLLILTSDEEGVGWCPVAFTPEEAKAIAGYHRRVTGRCVVAGRPLRDRPDLDLPKFFDVGEYGF